MYDLNNIPQDTLDWVLAQSLNELNAYLCEGYPWKELGESWPEVARKMAEQCRIIA